MWILITLISNKIASDFIDDTDQYKIKPITIILPKTRACLKNCVGSATKWIYFLD